MGINSTAEIECKCGNTVFLEDLGDSPMYLSGECEHCGRQWSGNELAGFECDNENEIEEENK